MLDILVNALRNRSTQLVVRGITFVLAAIFGPKVGADPEIAGKLTAACPIIVGIIFDLIIHSANYGKVCAVLEDHAGVAPPAPPAPSNSTDTSTTMKFIGITLLSSVLMSCSAFAQPTNPTPQDIALKQVVDAEELYLLATTPIEAAIASGSIKGTEALALQAAEKVAWDYIEAAYKATKEGHTVDAQTQLELFKTARADLIQAFGKAKVAPTTQPG